MKSIKWKKTQIRKVGRHHYIRLGKTLKYIPPHIYKEYKTGKFKFPKV